MSNRDRFIVFSLFWFGLVFLVYYVGWRDEAFRRLPLLFLVALAAGGLTLLGHNFLSGVAGDAVGKLYEGSGEQKRRPALSKARSFIIRDEFEAAHEELDGQWAQFPGDGDIMREYERLFQAMNAPAELAQHLDSSLPKLKGEDHAWGLLRLAELVWHEQADRDRAISLCTRLLSEHPSSMHSPAAKELLKVLRVGVA